MNKRIVFIAGAWIAGMLAAGCVEDTGNYDYLEAGQVIPGAISGVEESYNVIALDYLEIDPAIAGDTAGLAYTWHVYAVPTFPGTPDDTIGREKKLAYRMILPTGRYELVLEVKDRERLTSAYKRATLNVTAAFSRGWFIAKETGGTTEIDFITLDNNTLHPDILKTINGDSPAGKPVANGYTSSYYCYEVDNPDGTTSMMYDQPALFVATDSDLHVYHATGMNRLKTFPDAFFETPDVQQPRGLFAATGGTVLFNDGKLHAIWNGAYNVGKFGYQVDAPALDLSPHALRAGSGFLFYDRLSCSFKALTAYDPSALVDLMDIMYPSLPSCNNMDSDLVYMHEQESAGGLAYAYALMKNRTTGQYYILDMSPEYILYGMSPFSNIINVPAGSEVSTASVHAIHHFNDALYYSRGDNTVGYFSISSGQDHPSLITLPAGEEVAYIRHVYHDNSPFQCLAVLANRDNAWKLYLYHFVGYTPDVQLPAYQTFSGEGTARSLLYRDVHVTSTN
jgi:hypothetical protein